MSRLKAQDAKSGDDMARRILAAQNEFQALVARHRVRVVIEQGESTEIGRFTRIVFVPAELPGPGGSPPA